MLAADRTKINRRPDSFESLDARAALPQNCSLIKLRATPFLGNGPSVPASPTNVPPARYLTESPAMVDWVLFCRTASASNHNAGAAAIERGATTTRFRPPALAAYRAVSAW